MGNRCFSASVLCIENMFALENRSLEDLEHVIIYLQLKAVSPCDIISFNGSLYLNDFCLKFSNKDT
jgi:hypothetical protein